MSASSAQYKLAAASAAEEWSGDSAISVTKDETEKVVYGGDAAAPCEHGRLLTDWGATLCLAANSVPLLYKEECGSGGSEKMSVQR